MSGYARLLDRLQHWHPEAPVAMFLVDINDFRSINRLASPRVADRVLAEVEERIGDWAGNDGLAARLWSDEFVAVRPIDHPQAAGELAIGLRDCIACLDLGEDLLNRVLSVSIGVVCSKPGRDWERLLAQAGEACDAAKLRGVNQISVYTPRRGEAVAARTRLEQVAEFRALLSGGHLGLHAQPVIDIARLEPRIAKAEFLLRIDRDGVWTPPPPGMIQALEGFGASAELDQFSTQYLLNLLAEQPALLDRLEGVSVNLSAQSFVDDLLMSRLHDDVRHARLPPGKLCFEITETAAIQHLSVAAEVIADFHAIGCRFSLDDFGSGLCSFGYLQALMIDEVKVDGSFIREIADNPVTERIICAIHQVARATNKSTVAEYVDDVRKLAAIRRIGFDYAQGWLFHPAMDPDEFRELLERSPGLITSR